MKKVGLFLCGLAALWCGAVAAAELVLADGGKTDYAVVSKPKPTDREFAAANDLRRTLKEITGADFSADKRKTKHIYVGVKPDCDKEPLQEGERRITSVGGDIYLYGEGRHGNDNAVYDFLRDVLGCRWINPTGDRTALVKRPKLVLGELKKSIVPSIPYYTGNFNSSTEHLKDFNRRLGVYEKGDLYAGVSGHAGQIIIPSGKIPFGGKVGNIHGPLKYFKDKAYFQTNPEFFALGAFGKRTTELQLCYSNPQLRDEYAHNIEIVLKGENYDGGRMLFSLLHDDHGGKFCYCKNCEALEKKYDHPAGAFYDFLFDMCRRFDKKYPNLTFICSAYRADQTLKPPPHITELPRNMQFGYSPLGCDFSKPLTHPINAGWAKPMRDWAKISRRMRFSVYPTTYPRPVVSYPLTANIHRLVENLRFAYGNKARMIFCEFGSGPYNSFGFNDLRVYMIGELCRDIDRDEQAIVKEFMDVCYGPASEMMQSYLAELEKIEAAYPKYLRWNPDILTMEHATAANLLRWERNFDKMEKLAGGNARHLLNLRRARYNLDQMVIAKWPYMAKEEQAKFGDLEAVIARACKTLVDDAKDVFAGTEDRPEWFKTRVERKVAGARSGLDQYIARARGGKPLPKQFSKYKTVYRILPNRNKLGLDADSDAPFGLCNTGRHPVRRKSWLSLRTYVHGRKPAWESAIPPLPMGPRRFQKQPPDGKYQYYRLGAMPIVPDAQIDFSALSPQSGFGVGHLYDPKRPNRLFDFYVCAAVDPDKKWVKLGELVAIPLDKDAPKGKTPGRVMKDTVDEFL